MNDHTAAAAPPGSPLEVQVSALLKGVGRKTQQRCAQLRTDAEQQEKQILRSARVEARKNVRKAIVEVRARIEQESRQAQAHAELEAHQHAQREIQALLEYMWQHVVAALEARWANPVHRRAWIEATLAEAGALLSGRTWRIEHEDSWTADERREFDELARAKGARALEWVADPQIQAGLRIHTDGVCLAATVPGLLVQRQEIESAFLADYFASAPGASEPRTSEPGDGRSEPPHD